MSIENFKIVYRKETEVFNVAQPEMWRYKPLHAQTRRDIHTNCVYKIASRWLSDIQESFEAILRLIETDKSLTTAAGSGYDAGGFHFRRLHAYERT